jgi:hypothetical protein
VQEPEPMDLEERDFSPPGDRPRTSGDLALLIALVIKKGALVSDYTALGIANEALQVLKYHGLRIVWRPRRREPPSPPKGLLDRWEKKRRERR